MNPTNMMNEAQTPTDGGGLWRPAMTLFVLLSLLTGLAYPLGVTAIATAAFPHQAAGSLIVRDGRVIGSELIGQAFADPKHFWSRPSATAGGPYNGLASGGSNLAPSNPALVEAAQARIAALRAADPGNTAAIPVDLVTASASGLDPHISRAAANYQVRRVARQRSMDTAAVQSLVDAHTEWPLWGGLGEPRINVLRLNLALDAAAGSK